MLNEIIYAVIATALFFIIITTVFTYRKLFHRKKRSIDEEINTLIDRKLISQDYYENLKLTKTVINSFDGYTLAGYFIKCKNPAGCIILSHGISCNHASMISNVDIFQKKNLDVLLIDQRGHGRSSKTPSTYGFRETKDISLWIKYLSDSGYDKVGIMGHSMGAVIALLSCREKYKPDFIIAESAFSNLYELTKYQLKLKKLPSSILANTTSLLCKIMHGFWLSDIDVLNTIKKTSIPMLFIHGNKDRLTPCYMSETMAKETNSKIFIADDCSHHIFKNIKNSIYEYENAIDDFLLFRKL